jgi:hypothetical protein
MRYQQDTGNFVMAGAALKYPKKNMGELHDENKGFGVPVALFNFNRPRMTRQVFEVVRKIKPKRLLLVADGPRVSRPEDVRLCAEVRAVFDQIDWECEVSRNFSDTNLGSFKRNSSGLNWVFDTVEEAIIIEDDCIPSLSFFPYCEVLLEKYRDDPRVGIISGSNFGFPKFGRKNDSYFFSAYAFSWGWASWRRTWQNVDLSMSWWEPMAGRKLLRTVFPENEESEYWYELYERIRLGKQNNAWDNQMFLSSLRHSQCSVIPQKNMVSNIGYGVDGTNCRDENSPFQNLKRHDMVFPLIHPIEVRRNAQVDHVLFRRVFRYRPKFWKRAMNKLLAAFRRHEKLLKS